MLSDSHQIEKKNKYLYFVKPNTVRKAKKKANHTRYIGLLTFESTKAADLESPKQNIT